MAAAVALTLLCASSAGQQGVEDNEAAIVLEIQRLMQPDETLADESARNAELLGNLRKIPPLLAAMDKNFPAGRYRALAHGLALDALVMRRGAADKSVTTEVIADSARKMLALAKDDDARAHAQFALLQVVLADIPPTASQPATASAGATTRQAASQAAARAALADVADKLVKLAGQYAQTPYAAPALFLAGGAFLEAQDHDAAVAALDRLSRDHAKDPYSLQALMILVQMHTDKSRPAQALAAKRRVVENFPDSLAALKYRADIAQAECVGKPFFLRFKSLQGDDVDVTKSRGKTVLVYFYLSLADEKRSTEVIKNMQRLAALAQAQGCLLLAVGADAPDSADAVAKVLADNKIATPNLSDSDGKVADQYGVLLVPSVAVVSPDGTLGQIVAAADIVAEVAKVLKPAASAPVTTVEPSPARTPTAPAGK